MARGYTDIAAHVEKFGPCRSTTLVKALTAKGGTAEAARKRVSRAVQQKTLWRAKGLSFPRGESFVFLKDQLDTPLLVQRLWEDLADSGSVVAHGVHGVHARGGLITAGHFAGISGSPGRVKGHLSHERVQLFLQTYKLLEDRRVEGVGDCLQLGEHLPFEVKSTPARLKARLLAEELTINHLSRWFAHMGMIGFGSSQVRTKTTQPEFGQFFWDMTAPSYVFPFMSRRAGDYPIPGFVVADVMISGQVQVQHVRAFLRKCEVIRSQKNQRPFLSILVGEQFSKEAFEVLRKNGSMASTINNLLGEELAEALKALIQVLTNTAASMAADPEQISVIFDSLNVIEGAAANLRGPLFELIVAHCVGREGGQVDVQKAIRDPETNELTDIDVFRVKPSFEVVSYECKGHLGNVQVSKPEVEKWLHKTIRKTRGYLQKNEDTYRNMRQRFEFWTTGTFHPDALSYLQESKQKMTKLDFDWKDGQQVLEYVAQTHTGKLDCVLREHYLKHALVTVENATERRRKHRPKFAASKAPAEEVLSTPNAVNDETSTPMENS